MTSWRRTALYLAGAAVLMTAASACTHDQDNDTSTHRVSAALANVTEATVDVVSGADSVVVRAADLGDDLYDMSTPGDARVRPRVVVADGVYQVHLVDTAGDEANDDDRSDDSDRSDADRSDDESLPAVDGNDSGSNGSGSNGSGASGSGANGSGANGSGANGHIRSDPGRGHYDPGRAVDRSGPAALEIRLSDKVRWSLRLDGGAKLTTLDMAGGRLASVDLVAGVTRIEATLPRPEGTVVIRMRGGASVFDLRIPADVPARVRVGGGAGMVTIGGVTRSGVSGGTVFAPDDFDGAADRYDLDMAAGVSSLTVTAG